MSLLSRFFPQSHTRSHTLVINIGSATVSAALVDTGASPATILASESADITILPDLATPAFETETKRVIGVVLDRIAKLALPLPDAIAVYLASPWYASQVRMAKTSRPAPFVVSRSVVEDIISRELKAFEEEERTARYAGGEALVPLETKTVQVRLNGYVSADPIGKTARELELALFVSVAPERVVTEITEIIERRYSHQKPVFSSFLAASFLLLRDAFPHQGDFLLVDVGGELTDVSIIRDGALLQSVSFPKGRNLIVRALANGLGRSFAESVSICSLYVEGKVEESVRDSCEKILTQVKDDWLADFQKALFSISNELSIPDTVLLTSHDDVAAWFVETIRREEFHQYTLTEKEFKVILLDATFFKDKLSFAPGVTRDPFIMIDALGVSEYGLHKKPSI
jgi:hypothetical protein